MLNKGIYGVVYSVYNIKEMEYAPHRLVCKVLVSVVDGLQETGDRVASTLDRPLRHVGAPLPGPHKMADRYLRGSLEGTKDLIGGVSGALDVPVEILGVPPRDFL